MSRTSQELHHSTYFQGPDDNPDIPFDGYEGWLDSLDHTIDDYGEPTPVPARRFTADEPKPWERDTRCPVCGAEIPPQACVCVSCIRDAEIVEEPCSTCGDPADDAWTGLCGPCLLAAITEDDARAERALASQKRFH